MFRTYLIATAALVAGAPVMAHGPGEHGAGAAAMPDVSAQGSMNASERATIRANENSAVHSNTTDPATGTNIRNNTTRATKSEGPEYASPRAIERANENSVLARNAVDASTLTGLTTGLTVNDSTGAPIGSVSQVITGTDGSIRMVIVTSSTGETIRLMPNQLSISGSVVTTTQTDLGD